MLRACGVEVVERSGSRVGLRMGKERIVVHRPHPRPNTGRATVRDIASFLKAAGVPNHDGVQGIRGGSGVR